jgi:hypothetical protein
MDRTYDIGKVSCYSWQHPCYYSLLLRMARARADRFAD